MIARIFFIISIILIWQIIVFCLNIPVYIIPGPLLVGKKFISDWNNLSIATFITISESIAGLGSALIITGIFAFLFAVRRGIETRVAPLLVALQSIPILAIAPLLTLWFGPGYWSKVVASFLICFFPLLTGWSSGIASVDEEELDFFRTMNANKIQTSKMLLFPRSLPFFFSGLRVAAPLSLMGAIVGEFVGASNGLGFLILSYSYYAKTADMFACIFIVAVCGIIAYKISLIIEYKVVFWQAIQNER
jgi:NitT/TauT family transport system permease protein